MSKTKKLLALLLVLFVIIFAGYKYYNKPHIDVAETSANLSIEYQSLIDEFTNNETEANSKYLDQIVQVTGPIVKLDTVRGKLIISLGKEKMFGNVTCHLTAEETEKKYDLKEGQVITLKGICTGYLANVVLVKSVLIN